MYKKEKNKQTYTHNSPAVPTYCINVAIIIMQKNIFILCHFSRVLPPRLSYIRKFFGVIDNKYAA